MAQHNFTLVLATAKGGAGKSTLACCLAAELLNRGRPVTLIDCDPEQNTRRWHASGEALQAAKLISDPTEGVTAAARLAASQSAVLIDTAGARTVTTVAALEAADIVLIPFQASADDARAAIRMAALAGEVAAARRRRVPIYCVLNRVTKTAITEHIRGEMNRAGIQLTSTEIHNRTAYAAASANGSAPCWMGSAGEKAAQEISQLATELGL